MHILRLLRAGCKRQPARTQVAALHDGGRVQLVHPEDAGSQDWTACQKSTLPGFV